MKSLFAPLFLALLLAWFASSCSCNGGWTRPKTGEEQGAGGNDAGDRAGLGADREGIFSEGEGQSAEGGVYPDGGEGEDGEGEAGSEDAAAEGEGSCTPNCLTKCGGAPDGCGGTCTGACGPRAACRDQVCMACGSEEQPCCDGEVCQAGFYCNSDGSVCSGRPSCPKFTDAYGIAWLCLPPGTFRMGCSPGDNDCEDTEKPAHQVTVSAFKMTETEVTQGQFLTVLESNPSHFADCGGNCPVEDVDMNQARRFCGTVGGWLPSEAEWEYAARAGTTTKYYCGDEESCLENIAWYSANGEGTTHPVKEKAPNAFGLYDMLGNVWEWVEDSWHWDYQGAPTTGETWAGSYSMNVSRGGSWRSSAPRFLRASTRGNLDLGSSRYINGFRCASSFP